LVFKCFSALFIKRIQLLNEEEEEERERERSEGKGGKRKKEG
jgi:hypothetical protein